jgi:hypothetical protein
MFFFLILEIFFSYHIILSNMMYVILLLQLMCLSYADEYETIIHDQKSIQPTAPNLAAEASSQANYTQPEGEAQMLEQNLPEESSKVQGYVPGSNTISSDELGDYLEESTGEAVE